MLTDSYRNDVDSQASGQKQVRILLVDDHPFVRQGIKATLEMERGFQVVGEVGDGLEVVKTVEHLKPDVVVLDHVLPGATGMEVAEAMSHQHSNTHIIMMSMYADEAYVGCALSLGVRGYISKRAASSELVEAIHAVMAGERYLSAPHSNASIEEYMEGAKAVNFDVYKTLTDRERQVGDLIVEGFSSRRMAEHLCISERTVETHRSHIKKKLGAQTTAEMVRVILQYRERYGET